MIGRGAAVGPALLAAASIGCAPPAPGAAESKHAARHACDYLVSRVGSEVLTLNVRVRCHGVTARGLAATDDLVARRIAGRTADGRKLDAHGSKLLVAAGSEASGFEYRVDLDAIAGERDDPEIADRVGNSWIAPASTWLLPLEPTPAETAVHARVAANLPFSTALEPSGDGWELFAHQLRTATYSVFGAFRQSALELPGHDGAAARLRIAVLDGHVDPSDALLRAWIARSARSVSAFFHGFPVDDALVAVVPVPGDATVGWGALLPENGCGIALNVGEHVTERVLDTDWILVHELFHVGVPSFIGEGKWLDEGLATYYEPIIRARSGKLRELDVWTEFARGMPQASAALREGLENSRDGNARYWGGAAVVLLADLEARRRSDGARGLEEGLRHVLDRGGDARRIWKLARVYATVDEALGAPILTELGSRYAIHGASVDFARLFGELGVIVNGSAITLSDRAPLAALRRNIVRAAPAR